MSNLPILIPDEPRKNVKGSQLYPPEYEGHFDSLMIGHQEILDCVEQLAAQIHKDYKGERPVLVCVLKGASSFYCHLLQALQELRQGFTTEFLRVSSYTGTSSTGTVQVEGDSDDPNRVPAYVQSLKGRHVLLIEDIVDTGTTLSRLIPMLQEKTHPKSLQVCSLLQKRLAQPPKVSAKYIGFSIPDHFVIGYGLDYNELYRDLRDIWIISKQGIDFDASTI